MMGTWYSRRILARNSKLQSFAMLLERTDNLHKVRAYYNRASGGYCQRPLVYDLDIADEGHGVWWRRHVTPENNDVIMDGNGVQGPDLIKIMWTDYDYAVVYTCEEITDADACANDREFIDIIARDTNAVPVTVVDKFKQVLHMTSYQLGDLVMSEHTVHCEQYSCTVANVGTVSDVITSQLYGRWELIASSLSSDVGVAPTSLEIMIGNGGTSRLAMTRQMVT